MRPKSFRLAVKVVFNDGVGGVQNGLRRTIILLQQNNSRIWIILLEIQNVAHIRAAPTVNRLIGITDDANVFVFGGKLLCQNVLRNVCILILVDGNVLETLLITLQNVGIFVEKIHGRENQIVEVQRIILPQLFLIQPVNLRDAFVPLKCSWIAPLIYLLKIMRGINQIVFEVGDFEVRVGKKFFVEIQFGKALLDKRPRVADVVNRKVAREFAGDFNFPPQKSCAKRMERTQHDVSRGRAD